MNIKINDHEFVRITRRQLRSAFTRPRRMPRLLWRFLARLLFPALKPLLHEVPETK